MRFETSIAIDAPPDRVWSVLTDVERWPEWTASMTSVERLEEGPFAVGSRARIRQPKFPAAVWEVVDLEPGRSFVWIAKAPGATTTAEHRLAPQPGGGVDLTLSIDQAGVLAPLVGLFAARTTRRYVRLEAEGLQRRCEDPAGH